jgi:hypothetical protein
MTAFFSLIKISAFVVGFCLSLAILPVDYLFLLIQEIWEHTLVVITKTLRAPFVIIRSAAFDRELWPSYLEKWQRAHRRIDLEWSRPLRRFSELGQWLPAWRDQRRWQGWQLDSSSAGLVSRAVLPQIDPMASEDGASYSSRQASDSVPSLGARAKFRPTVVRSAA